MPDHPRATATESSRPHPARVLVADDDAASCRFLCDALRSLGVVAHPMQDGSAALALARAERFDLLLLDCRMPGAGARQILSALRDDPHAASAQTVAVASSADITTADEVALRQAGFAGVLLKPCKVADLAAVLELLVDGSGCLLDDGAAIDSSGSAATMLALRGLLRAELLQLGADLEALKADRHALGERLHRLRSSCGFCGAAALSRQTVLLQGQLNNQGTPVTLEPFRHAMQATLDALPR